MKFQTRYLSLLALSVSALNGGCAVDAAGDPALSHSKNQPVLDGSAATAPKYAAIGGLVQEIPFVKEYQFRCSGTLIAPKVVLTARHCVSAIDFAQSVSGGFAKFVYGDDVWNPDTKVNITGYQAAPASPSHPGLLFDGGRDLAVVYLQHAPRGVKPANIAQFPAAMLGEQFELVGYGISDGGRRGFKFAGPATARALAGDWYKLLFADDYEAYLSWYFADSVSSRELAEAEAWWDVFQLEPGYELLAGGLAGESVGCFGDSGGPLLRVNAAGDPVVYGVNFAGESSVANYCDHGSAITVLNEEMLSFVQAAAAAAK